MVNILRRWGLLIVLIIVFLVFSLLVPQFSYFNNFMNIFRAASLMAIFALGLTVIINAGEFDLSFTAIGTIAAVIGGVLLLSNGISLTVTIIVALLIGIILGAVNGLLVAYVGIPAFISTLGMWGLLIGFSGFFTDGADYYDSNWPKNLGILGRSIVAKVIPTPVIIFIIVTIVIIIYIEFTKSGKHLLAVGGNSVAAKYIGIKVKKVKLNAYIISGFVSALAGITSLSMLGLVNQQMVQGYQMPAISAVFLGAIFLRDGIPNVFGTIVASILLAVITNGLVMMGAKWYVSNIVQGAILIIVGLLAILKKGKLMSVSIG